MLGTDGYANTFNGSLDEVLYYNRSLSPSEVSDLYKAGLSQHANANVTLETRVATSYNVSDASLVGLWGLNGNANDELGVNNGTWQGDETYGEGNGTVGQGGYFDGTGDYVNFTDSNSLSPGNITISSWVKFSNSGGTPIFIMKDHEYLIQAVESGTDVIRVGVSFSGTTFTN